MGARRHAIPSKRAADTVFPFPLGAALNWLDEWGRTEGSPELAEVYRRFGDGAFRRTAAHNGLAEFVRTSGFSGRHCVEIGSFRGLTAVILSGQFGFVTSIDIVNEPMKHRIVEHLGVGNVRFRHIRGNREKVGVLGDMDFDAAYVDGNHVDARFDFGLVERCGRVMFHEYWPAKPPVWGLVNGLRDRGDRVTVFRNFALWERS